MRKIAKKGFPLMVIAVCLFPTIAAAHTQEGENIYVNRTNNTAGSYLLDAVRKLTFTGSQLVVHLRDGNQDATVFTDLRHLTFAPFFNGGESIEPVQGKREIGIYPNPVNDELQIVGYTLQHGETVAIFDVSGRLVLSASATVINVSALAKGIYFVQAGNAEIIKIIMK